MDIVFAISIPVFGIGLLGYFAAALGYFSRNHSDGLSHFVHQFAVPLLLFRTIAHISILLYFIETHGLR